MLKFKKKNKKKEIWPIRVSNDSIIYIDLKNCDQKALAKEILKIDYGVDEK